MALIKLLNEFYVYIFEDRVHVKMSIRFQITIFQIISMLFSKEVSIQFCRNCLSLSIHSLPIAARWLLSYLQYCTDNYPHTTVGVRY